MIKNYGLIILAIYLILVGIMILTGVTVPAVIMGVLAIAAGGLILFGK
jgi:hypothetical protein